MADLPPISSLSPPAQSSRWAPVHRPLISLLAFNPYSSQPCISIGAHHSFILPPRPWIHAQGRRTCQVASRGTSWGGEVPDWDLEPYASDEELEDEIEAEVLGPGGGGGPEFLFQNALAAVLLATLALSVGNILFKLVVVAFALVSTAFRYSAVGLLVIFLLALFS